MARSNIKTHISIHISMEIIQGIQTHIDLHFHLYSPPQKLLKTENRGMNLTLGCWFGFCNENGRKNEVFLALAPFGEDLEFEMV